MKIQHSLENKSGIKKLILVIDDERGYRDFYGYMLEPFGYEVHSAEDGKKGLEMALQNEYEAIFLDVHMPGLKGPDVLKMIKQAKPKQIVIIFSSSSDPSFSFEKKARDMGAFDCLYKPVEVDDILKVLRKALGVNGNGKQN